MVSTMAPSLGGRERKSEQPISQPLDPVGNIRDKGRNLFADMSGEIHGYDQRRRNTFDYEHFDVKPESGDDLA